MPTVSNSFYVNVPAEIVVAVDVSPNQGQMERNEVLRNKTSMLINTIFF
jgi:hypothetical protein